MKLHLVIGNAPDEENLDLFVWANERETAVRLWQECWGVDHKPRQVRVIPLTEPSEPSIISWGRIPDA